MDLSALSEERFNAVAWINANYQKYLEENAQPSAETTNATAGAVADGSEVAFINAYVSKLQLYVQQVTYAMEDTSQQLIGCMPKIIKDARHLQDDVQALQKRMAAMRHEVSAVQAETGECMSTLEHLNRMQTKLQAAKESLQESDGWGNLVAELEDCFERGELQGASEKLVALQKSLHAQEQLAGHSDRLEQVEDFKNRLEALASPCVVQSIDEASVEQAQHYVRIFAGIGRMPQLYAYYRAVQKNSLQQQWKQTLDLQATEPLVQQQHFLTLFYDQLVEHCQRQVRWCGQVFAGEALGRLQPFVVVSELLPALQPSRDAHILQLFKTSNERLELLQLYAQANHTFVGHLQACLEQGGGAAVGDTALADTRRQLGEAVYEYFFKFVQQYPRLEETHLSTLMDRLIVSASTCGDAVRHLEDSNRKVFDWLAEARQRCASISSDLALCKFVGLLGGILRRVLGNFSKTQRQLSVGLVAASEGVGGGGGGGATENWSLLQYTVTLLQCLADFQQRLGKYERSLHDGLAALGEQLQAAALKQGGTASITIYHICEPAEAKRLLATIADYQQKRSEAAATAVVPSLGIFTAIYESLAQAHFAETHDIALDLLLQPIEQHLAGAQPPPDALGRTTAGGGVGGDQQHFAAGAASDPADDLPAFSYAPQEAITQIGQYLLTLPQHLEPLLLAPSPLLRQALEACHVKYTQPDVPCSDVLLSLVVEQCCGLYQAQILQLKALPAAAAKQLAVDIEYLASVVEELGLSLSASLAQILALLQAPPENYLTLSSGCEPRLVTAIRQMRNIISTQ